MLITSNPSIGQDFDIDQARILRSQDRTYEAFDLFEQAPEPLSAEGLLLKGVLLAELGRTAEAKLIFLELIKDQPGAPEPLNNLAVLYANAGDYDLALKSLHRAIATRPEFFTTYRNLNQVSTRMATEAYGRETGRDLAEDPGPLILGLLPELTGSSLRLGHSNIPDIGADPNSLLVVPPLAEIDPPVNELDESRADSDVAGEAATESRDLRLPEETATADPGLAWSMIQQWAKARSSQSASDFAAFYSSDFEPGRGLSREEWDARMRRKFESTEPLSIALEFLEARRTGSKQTEVRFRQTLSLGGNSYGVTVTLSLVWEENSWKIQSEYRNQ